MTIPGLADRVAALEARLDALSKEVRTERVVVVRRGEEVIKLETSGSEQGESATIVVNAPGRAWQDNLLLSAWTWRDDDGSTKADISVELHKDEHLAGNWSTLEGIQTHRVAVLDGQARERVVLDQSPSASFIKVIAPGRTNAGDEDTLVEVAAMYGESVITDPTGRQQRIAEAGVSILERGDITVLLDGGHEGSEPYLLLEENRVQSRQIKPSGDRFLHHLAPRRKR